MAAMFCLWLASAVTEPTPVMVTEDVPVPDVDASAVTEPIPDSDAAVKRPRTLVEVTDPVPDTVTVDDNPRVIDAVTVPVPVMLADDG